MIQHRFRSGDPTHQRELSTVINGSANSIRHCVLMLSLCLVVWVAYLPSTFAHNQWIYSWDSAAYIETANSIHAGRGLMQRVIHDFGDEIWEPISWWPPGYPILIATLQMTGLSAMVASLTVSVGAAGLSVILLTLVWLRFFDWRVALFGVLTLISMPAFLQISTQSMSDSSYLAFVVASIGCLSLWSTKSHDNRSLLFTAGLFAGASWTVRNVGVALIFATLTFLIIHCLWLKYRDVTKICIAWLVGVSVCGLPLIVRNLVTFGHINPYEMPPSELTLWSNLDRTVDLLIVDMTTLSARWADEIAQKFMIPVYAVIAGLIAWKLLKNVKLSSVPAVLRSHRIQSLLIGYIFIYLGIVIAARTKYRWGELIDPRHLVQIYWVIWLSFALFVKVSVRWLDVPRGAITYVLVAIFACTAGLQANRQIGRLVKPVEKQWDSVDSIIGREATNFLAANVKNDQIVLATRADLLRIFADINARKLPPVSQYDFLQPLTLQELRRLGDSGFLWGLVIDDAQGAKQGAYDTLVKDILEAPEKYPELQLIQINGPTIILQYVGNGVRRS
jgi:hypothetical protein